jgi:hypothetical protein
MKLESTDLPLPDPTGLLADLKWCFEQEGVYHLADRLTRLLPPPKRAGKTAMNAVMKAADRDRAHPDWRESRHTFAFGACHPPRQMCVFNLRVIDDPEIRTESPDSARLLLFALPCQQPAATLVAHWTIGNVPRGAGHCETPVVASRSRSPRRHP